MSESQPPNQTKGQAEKPADDQDLMSLDELDNFILNKDPDFARELKEVRELPVDGSVDLDVVDLEEELAGHVRNPWTRAKGWRYLLVKILPFLPKLWEKYYGLKVTGLNLRSVTKEVLIWLATSAKDFAKSILHSIKENLKAFGALSRAKKVIAIGLALATVLTSLFVYRSYTKGVLPGDQEIIISSLEEWSGQTYKYDSENGMDSFYDSPRAIQNIMSLPKMVVNLQPSRSSGPNPMAAMEFFLDGMNADAIVEVKDREVEMVDLFQRTLEGMTYDELDTAEGKHVLTERLRQAVNGTLTKGKIRRVFIKEAVIKP